MKKYLSQKLPTLYNPSEKPCRVLDLGCGNGHLLFSILGSKSPDEDDVESEEESDDENEDQDQEEDPENEETRTSTMKASSNASLTKPQYCLGIDYSKLSIDLAKEISLKRGNGCENVRFQVSDLMQEDQVEQVRKSSMESLNEKEKSEREEGWDLVCDKGTLDAVSCNNDRLQRKRKSSEALRLLTLRLAAFNSFLPHRYLSFGQFSFSKCLFPSLLQIALSSLENSIPNYLKAVKRLTRSKEGLFIITSCNFTEKELSQMFTDTKGSFRSLVSRGPSLFAIRH